MTRSDEGRAEMWAFFRLWRGIRDLSTQVEYKTVLSPEQLEVYSRLRHPRKIVAEKDGLPVFAV